MRWPYDRGIPVAPHSYASVLTCELPGSVRSSELGASNEQQLIAGRRIRQAAGPVLRILAVGVTRRRQSRQWSRQAARPSLNNANQFDGGFFNYRVGGATRRGRLPSNAAKRVCAPSGQCPSVLERVAARVSQPPDKIPILTKNRDYISQDCRPKLHLRIVIERRRIA